MHHHRGVRIGLTLALVLAADGLAQSSGVEQARETLQRMRELRKAREAVAAHALDHAPVRTSMM